MKDYILNYFDLLFHVIKMFFIRVFTHQILKDIIFKKMKAILYAIRL